MKQIALVAIATGFPTAAYCAINGFPGMAVVILTLTTIFTLAAIGINKP